MEQRRQQEEQYDRRLRQLINDGIADYDTQQVIEMAKNKRKLPLKFWSLRTNSMRILFFDFLAILLIIVSPLSWVINMLALLIVIFSVVSVIDNFFLCRRFKSVGIDCPLEWLKSEIVKASMYFHYAVVVLDDDLIMLLPNDCTFASDELITMVPDGDRILVSSVGLCTPRRGGNWMWRNRTNMKMMATVIATAEKNYKQTTQQI